ncbi:hypothetical protein SAMN05518871_107167 [Psychrobacillus sp. OK028]|uniref:hypothetical protein n=1 Tax=Psychrobacillus sp. OK028 TaxID=1884359 RepID=UPI000890F095|nr:hypothetical protein [Psychrobacillus sp. OK028]SDN76886.1 hypothetical protein SAMN05518871_107167 [Psychrobacillus sp. OK028]
MTNDEEQQEIKLVLEAMKQLDKEELEMMLSIGKRMLVDEEYKQYIVNEREKLNNGTSSLFKKNT